MNNLEKLPAFTRLYLDNGYRLYDFRVAQSVTFHAHGNDCVVDARDGGLFTILVQACSEKRHEPGVREKAHAASNACNEEHGRDCSDHQQGPVLI